VSEIPANLIYGLIDPRTRLIRYVGLSSTGMKRPQDHRRSSCPDTYCRRWVRKLQSRGLDYKITVLEVVKDIVDLRGAERWWIAYGRACGWPLTNLTDGGGPSEAALAERRRRNKESALVKAKAAEEARAERQRQLAEYDRARAEREQYLKQLAELWTGETGAAARLLRRSVAAARDPEIRKRCFQLFEERVGIGDRRAIEIEAVRKTNVTLGTARQLFDEWSHASYQRGKRLLKIEQSRLVQAARYASRRATGNGGDWYTETVREIEAIVTVREKEQS
jgi:hypothetical protein